MTHRLQLPNQLTVEGNRVVSEFQKVEAIQCCEHHSRHYAYASVTPAGIGIDILPHDQCAEISMHQTCTPMLLAHWMYAVHADIL